ncbi:MAG: MarR family winged helix-turn-helix transcriptional regulator [Spirochaetota bacterium]|nr:MarR family winged helix-turn-helix transcriptional regulator [Spirochaetota bacterium]
MTSKKIISEKQIHTMNQLIQSVRRTLVRYHLNFICREKLENMNPGDMFLLKLVLDQPDIIIKDILEKTGIPGSTLTSSINRLESSGYIRRIINQRDRRSFGLELTNKGKKLHNRHERVEQEVALEALSALDNDDERETLVELLSKINENLK